MTTSTHPRLTALTRVRDLNPALTESQEAYAVEHLIEAARVGKTSVAKLSAKRVALILEGAIAEADTSDIEIDDDQPENDIVLEDAIVLDLVARIKGVRGSHATCDHANTKVARAACRRARAKEIGK